MDQTNKDLRQNLWGASGLSADLSIIYQTLIRNCLSARVDINIVEAPWDWQRMKRQAELGTPFKPGELFLKAASGNYEKACSGERIKVVIPNIDWLEMHKLLLFACIVFFLCIVIPVSILFPIEIERNRNKKDIYSVLCMFSLCRFAEKYHSWNNIPLWLWKLSVLDKVIPAIREFWSSSNYKINGLWMRSGTQTIEY